MKKGVKIVVIILVTIVSIIAILIAGVFAMDFLEDIKLRNERINKSTTLSKFVEYHDWKHVGGTLGALEFHAKDIKCDLLENKKILYYDGDYFFSNNKITGILILDDYTIYETAFNSDMLYSNGQQYKKLDINVKIKRLQTQYSNLYLIGEDNKSYVINSEKKIINESEPNGVIEKHLLKDDSIISFKRVVLDDGTARYIVLKKDGQIYEQQYESKYSSAESKHIVKRINEKVLYSNNEYGYIKYFTYGNIGTHNGMGSIVSDKGVYWAKETVEQQYIDIEPTYELVLSEVYNRYKSDILYVNSEYVFTKDKNIVSIDALIRDLDKDMK